MLPFLWKNGAISLQDHTKWYDNTGMISRWKQWRFDFLVEGPLESSNCIKLMANGSLINDKVIFNKQASFYWCNICWRSFYWFLVSIYTYIWYMIVLYLMAFNVSFTSCFNLVQLSGKLPEMLSLNFIILHLHEITTQTVSNYIISWEPDFLSLFFFDIQQRFRVGVNAWVLKHFFCYLLFSCCFGTSFPSSFKSFILENPWTNSVSHWLLLLTVFLFWFLLNFGAVHLSLFWCCSFL